MPDNLYQVLGVERDAESEVLIAAIDRLSRQASALANAAPERSQQIREQLRSAKEHLLSGSEARERYDKELARQEEEEAQRAHDAVSASRKVHLLDNEVALVAGDAVRFIRAGLYTAQAIEIGAALDRDRLEAMNVKPDLSTRMPNRALDQSDPGEGSGEPRRVENTDATSADLAELTSAGLSLSISQEEVDLGEQETKQATSGTAIPQSSQPAATGEIRASSALEEIEEIPSSHVHASNETDSGTSEISLAQGISPSSFGTTGLRVTIWVLYGFIMCLGYLVLWRHLLPLAESATSRVLADAYFVVVPDVLPVVLMVLVVWIGYSDRSLWRRRGAILSAVFTHAIFGYLQLSSLTRNLTSADWIWLFGTLVLVNWLFIVSFLESVKWGIVTGILLGGIRAGGLLYTQHHAGFLSSAVPIVVYYLALVILMAVGTFREKRESELCISCRSPIVPGNNFCTVCGANASTSAPVGLGLLIGFIVVFGAISIWALSKSSNPSPVKHIGNSASNSFSVTSVPPAIVPTTVATTTTLPSESSAANALASLLAQSVNDRQAIISAVQDVAQCGPNIAEDITTFSDAAASREELLSQLSSAPYVPALPAPMVQDLVNAWKASQQADQDFAAWATDESTGCTYNGTSDPNYQAASGPDAEATAAKTSFVDLWNPIATQYGLPTYAPSDL